MATTTRRYVSTATSALQALRRTLEPGTAVSVSRPGDGALAVTLDSALITDADRTLARLGWEPESTVATAGGQGVLPGAPTIESPSHLLFGTTTLTSNSYLIPGFSSTMAASAYGIAFPAPTRILAFSVRHNTLGSGNNIGVTYKVVNLDTGATLAQLTMLTTARSNTHTPTSPIGVAAGVSVGIQVVTSASGGQKPTGAFVTLRVG